MSSTIADHACIICAEDPSAIPEPFTYLSCGHAFHSSCISKWFQSKYPPSCPICRQEQPVIAPGVSSALLAGQRGNGRPPFADPLCLLYVQFLFSSHILLGMLNSTVVFMLMDRLHDSTINWLFLSLIAARLIGYMAVLTKYCCRLCICFPTSVAHVLFSFALLPLQILVVCMVGKTSRQHPAGIVLLVLESSHILLSFYLFVRFLLDRDNVGPRVLGVDEHLDVV